MTLSELLNDPITQRQLYTAGLSFLIGTTKGFKNAWDFNENSSTRNFEISSVLVCGPILNSGLNFFNESTNNPLPEAIASVGTGTISYYVGEKVGIFSGYASLVILSMVAINCLPEDPYQREE